MKNLANRNTTESQNDFSIIPKEQRRFNRILFLTCPTGSYCREDRCQSFFEASLVPSMRPPLEECEAGGAISSSGSDFLVIDSPALKLSSQDVIERIFNYKPDLIILSVTFGSLDKDLQWAKIVKETLTDVPIGLRGAPCYVSAKDILESNPDVKFCIRGDYEVVFRSLIETGLEDSNGIILRNSNGTIIDNGMAIAEDLDLLPFPDRSGIDPSLYRVRALGAQQATIRVQRGCPFPCTYCLVHTVSGKQARHRSAHSIVSEMQELISQGTRFFYLRAETFTLDKDWTLALLREIATKCPSARWVTTTRVEHVDEEILREMRAAGCYGISFGLDVASEKISKLVKKPLRGKEALEALRLCNKYKIISLVYIMIGFIWETRSSLKEVSNFIGAIKPDLLTIHYAHPYPGTVYYEQFKSSQIKIISTRAQAEPALNPEQVTAKEVKACGASLLRQHYQRPAILLSIARKFSALVLDKLLALKYYN